MYWISEGVNDPWNPHNPMRHIWPMPLSSHSSLAPGPTTSHMRCDIQLQSSNTVAPGLFLGACPSHYLTALCTHLQAGFSSSSSSALTTQESHPRYSSLSALTKDVLLCLLAGVDICLDSVHRSSRFLQITRTQHGAWHRAGTPRNTLNPFIDEEIGTRSWDLILGPNPKSINLGTTLCGSLSCLIFVKFSHIHGHVHYLPCFPGDFPQHLSKIITSLFVLSVNMYQAPLGQMLFQKMWSVQTRTLLSWSIHFSETIASKKRKKKFQSRTNVVKTIEMRVMWQRVVRR